MELDFDIEIGEKVITVTFEAYPIWQDDSFNHEFGTEKIKPYLVLESYPTWHKEDFTWEENYWIIEPFITRNFKKIEKRFCKEYTNQLKQYEP